MCFEKSIDPFARRHVALLATVHPLLHPLPKCYPLSFHFFISDIRRFAVFRLRPALGVTPTRDDYSVTVALQIFSWADSWGHPKE